MRLGNVLEELRGSRSRDPDRLRSYAVDLVRELTQSSIGLYYRSGLVDERPLPVHWIVRGADDSLVRRQLEERIAQPAWDARLPDERWNRRFFTLRQILDPDVDLVPTLFYRRCQQPAGVHDVVRMIVCHEGRLVAWIGALRGRGEPPISRADVRRVAPLAGALADALVRAERIERAASQDGCDLVLRADGSVEMASASAQRVLATSGDALRSWVQGARRGAPPTVIDGHRVRWARLQGGDDVRYLVHLQPIEALALHPAWVLSRTQRDVGRLAAVGATVDEIARAMRIAPATVRTHLRHVYARLEVSTRAELARTLEPIPDVHDELRLSAPARPAA